MWGQCSYVEALWQALWQEALLISRRTASLSSWHWSAYGHVFMSRRTVTMHCQSSSTYEHVSICTSMSRTQWVTVPLHVNTCPYALQCHELNESQCLYMWTRVHMWRHCDKHCAKRHCLCLDALPHWVRDIEVHMWRHCDKHCAKRTGMTDDSSHFNVTNSRWHETLQCHELNE